MNKLYKQLFGILFAAICITLAASCSSDEPVTEIDDSGLPLIEEGQSDIAGGYNVLIVDLNKAEAFRHKLGTRRNIKLTHDSDIPVRFKIETAADTTRYIVVDQESLAKSDFKGIGSFKVNVSTTDNKASKDLNMVLRKVSSPTDISAYAYNIGRGTDIWNDLGNVTYPILDFGAISSHLEDNVNNVQHGISFEISGERYEETMEQMSVSVGIDGSSPTFIQKFFFTAGATFGQQSMNHTIKNMEYYLGFYGKVMAEVKLNPDWLEPFKAEKTLYTLLDETINDALNNPGSAIYQKYPDTKEGIFALLDHYGAHVITKAAFGGTYIWAYGRKENAYEHSIGHDASAHVMFKGSNGQQAVDWLDYYQKKHSSPYISAEGVGSDYDYNYEEASGAFERSMVTGGDANTDIETWDKNFSTEKPDKWVIVSYATLDDKLARFMHLQEFVQDTTSSRYKAISEYWKEYQYTKYKEPLEDELVLADFYMKLGRSQNHEAGDPQSFVDIGPDGKKYIYFPMMANGNFLYADSNDGFVYRDQQGYAAETNQDHFVSADTEKCHYWYYALGYASECNGITDILFDNDSHSGYTRRGNHANDGVSGLIDNNYTYVKTGSSSTPASEKIKAVGLYNHSNKDTNGDRDLWRIWATSGGAEMKLPFENAENQQAFLDYWEPYDNTGATSTVKGSTDFYIGWLGTANDIRIFYRKKSLPIRNLSFGNGNFTGKIQHPKKWGE